MLQNLRLRDVARRAVARLVDGRRLVVHRLEQVTHVRRAAAAAERRHDVNKLILLTSEERDADDEAGDDGDDATR